MADLISAQLPDELLLDIFNHSISDYGLVNDFWDSIATLRLTLHFHTLHFSSGRMETSNTGTPLS